MIHCNTGRMVILMSAASLIAEAQQRKSLVDYFLPLEPQGALVSEGIWGKDRVLPRDIKNGLEDADMSDWNYWDGSIVKDDAGRCHMYASRWTQTQAHSQGWKYHSKAIHAVSKNVMGPYVDQGEIHPDWQDGLGHNVVALRMHDGRYAVVQSERSPGEIFVSDRPEGPFTLLGKIQVDLNGFPEHLAWYDRNNVGAVRDKSVGYMSNVQIFLRPDGRYMLVPRSCCIMISDSGILGPYKILTEPVYRGIPELPQDKMEDPTVWYSGGLYHIVVNHWRGGDVSYHLTSEDGITGWKNRGIAFSKKHRIFKYTDGTENYWVCVQRPTVYVENGHPTHFLFSVIDAGKGGDEANDRSGSKIVIVPFDGEAFDRDMQKIVAAEKEKEGKASFRF